MNFQLVSKSTAWMVNNWNERQKNKNLAKIEKSEVLADSKQTSLKLDGFFLICFRCMTT